MTSCVECARTTAGTRCSASAHFCAPGARRGRKCRRRSDRRHGPPSVARFGRSAEARSPTVGTWRALRSSATMPPWRTPRGRGCGPPRGRGGDRRLIEAELLYRAFRRVRPSDHPKALHDSIPPPGVATASAAARELARDPAQCERVAAHLLAAGHAGPAGEPWAFDALTASARRASTAGPRNRRCDSCAGARGKRRTRCGGRSCSTSRGGVGPRVARGSRPHGAGATLSSSPPSARRRRSPLHGAFLAAEMPEAIAACEEVLEAADGLDRSCAWARVPAAATRLVGGLPSAETFARWTRAGSGPRETRRAQPARHDRGGVAATTAPPLTRLRRSPRRRGEMGSSWSRSAPSTPRWLPPQRRSLSRPPRRHRSRGQAYQGQSFDRGGRRDEPALDAPLLQRARPARLRQGLERRCRGADADAVAALALLPVDDPIVLPTALLRAHRLPHRARHARAGRDAAARGMAAATPATLRSAAPGLPRPAGLRLGDPSAALNDLEDAGGDRLRCLREPDGADVGQLRALASARLGGTMAPVSWSRRSSRSRDGSELRADRRALRVRPCSPRREMVERVARR